MRGLFAIALISIGILATNHELYAQGQEGDVRQLVWVDRSGQVLGEIGPRMNSILDPAISPDGSEVAVRGRPEWGNTDHLWVLAGEGGQRLTTNQGSERHMIYSPDGSRIAYSIQNSGGVSNLFVRPADGSGGDEPVLVDDSAHHWYPTWSADASTLVYHIAVPGESGRDLGWVNVETGETGILVDDEGVQALARFSRDGRFVAYQSDQDGQPEVYVTTFPRSDARWKVSTNGGSWPKWSHDELFYWEGNTLVAVPFTSDGGFNAGTPQRLFTGAQVGSSPTNMMTAFNTEYDVSADGQRFVVVQHLEQR